MLSERKFPKFVSASLLNNLLNQCIIADPNLRLSIENILRHEYFKSTEIPTILSCKEKLDSNTINTPIPEDYHRFAEILDRNSLIPYDDIFSCVLATAMQIFSRFREKRLDFSLVELVMPIVYLSADIHCISHEDVNYICDEDIVDLDEDMKIDKNQSIRDVIRIQREILQTLDFDLWFSTAIDYGRMNGENLIEIRNSLLIC